MSWVLQYHVLNSVDWAVKLKLELEYSMMYTYQAFSSTLKVLSRIIADNILIIPTL